MTVPTNSYLALGYGTGMTNTDSVMFTGNGAVKDLYSTANTTPSIDSSNAYSPATGTLSNGKYVYTSERAFDTGDAKDKVIECGKSYDFRWVGLTSSSDLL